MKNIFAGLVLALSFVLFSAFSHAVPSSPDTSLRINSLGGGQASLTWELNTFGTRRILVSDVTNGMESIIIDDDVLENQYVASGLVVGRTYRYEVICGSEWIVNEDVYH
jgi:hypothetical protein